MDDCGSRSENKELQVARILHHASIRMSSKDKELARLQLRCALASSCDVMVSWVSACMVQITGTIYAGTRFAFSGYVQV